MPSSVNRELHPADHMFNSGPDWYWKVGEQGLQVVRRILNLSDNRGVKRILDLPCGHGRVARYLRAGFPDAEMFFCDLDAEGAKFCARTFGGQPIKSREELTSVDLPRDCDVIWVGSLFTHVDRDRTERWLAHLCKSLSESGVLVATFHGAWTKKVAEAGPIIDPASWEQIVRECYETGYGYRKYLDHAGDYGISLSRPSVIVQMVEQIPGVRLLAYMERGWGHNHDVLGISGADRFKPW